MSGTLELVTERKQRQAVHRNFQVENLVIASLCGDLEGVKEVSEAKPAEAEGLQDSEPVDVNGISSRLSISALVGYLSVAFEICFYGIQYLLATFVMACKNREVLGSS